MKNIFIAITGILLSAQTFADIPHLEMELSGADYRKIFENQINPLDVQTQDQALNAILEMGKRNLDWLAFINSSRPEAARLHLSTPETQHGYPIESPKESNRTIVLQNNDALKAALPPAMLDILFNGVAFSHNPPVEDEIYLEFARRANGIYESASRWLLEVPYLSEYAARSAGDIRGYYYLNKEENLNDKLQNWAGLSVDDKARLKPYLLNECNNSTGNSRCVTEFDSTIQRNGNPLSFHQKYLKHAKETFDNYFILKNSRSDVQWDSQNANEMLVPFLRSERQDIQDYLKVNIEDEWKWGNWNLHLNFMPTGDSSMIHIVFEPGVTPHVDGLGGSEITMDANTSLNDYNTQWTIRHEYGHTLGFPDCYVEFYDNRLEVMVSYQLDITNLMCSRRGHLQQKHYDELKRVYFR